MQRSRPVLTPRRREPAVLFSLLVLSGVWNVHADDRPARREPAAVVDNKETTTKGGEAPNDPSADAPFEALIRQHLQAGTLLDEATARRFAGEGQGPAYRDSVARRFTGTSQDGLELTVRVDRNDPAAVGRPLNLGFELSNTSDQPRQVAAGSSCGIVHPLTFLVIDPKGRLWPKCGRVRVGGFHLCEPKVQELLPGKTCRLHSSTISELAVPFIPTETGAHVVIGVYELAAQAGPARQVQSRPIIVDVGKGASSSR